MEDFSVAVIFAGASKIQSEDETCPYLANRNFYYLTNIEQENSILILLKGCGNTKEYLFVSEYDEVKEKWYGKRLTSFEATKLSGIDNVLYLSSFDSMFGMILDDRNSSFSNINNVYLDFSKEQKIRENLFIETYISNLKLNYDNKNFIDIYPLIVRLRMVKSKQEIEEMKEAIAKTNVGLREIMKSLKEDTYEYKYSSLFYYTIQDYFDSFIGALYQFKNPSENTEYGNFLKELNNVFLKNEEFSNISFEKYTSNFFLEDYLKNGIPYNVFNIPYELREKEYIGRNKRSKTMFISKIEYISMVNNYYEAAKNIIENRANNIINILKNEDF